MGNGGVKGLLVVDVGKAGVLLIWDLEGKMEWVVELHVEYFVAFGVKIRVVIETLFF